MGKIVLKNDVVKWKILYALDQNLKSLSHGDLTKVQSR